MHVAKQAFDFKIDKTKVNLTKMKSALITVDFYICKVEP